jgi:hypothetical protein
MKVLPYQQALYSSWWISSESAAPERARASFPVPDQPLQVQILHYERLVLAHEGGRELVQPVFTTIPDSNVGSGQLQPSPFPTMGPLLLSRHLPSQVLDLPQGLLQVTGSLDLPAIGKDNGIRDPDVEPDGQL